MNRLRETVTLQARLDEHPIRIETACSVVGAVVVLETALPQPDLALTLVSTYLGHPGAETIASHVCAARDLPARSWSVAVPETQMPVWASRHRCLLDHVSVLQDQLGELGHRARLDVDEHALAAAGR